MKVFGCAMRTRNASGSQHVQHRNKKLMESKRPESLFDSWSGLQDEDGFDIIACKGDATWQNDRRDRKDIHDRCAVQRSMPDVVRTTNVTIKSNVNKKKKKKNNGNHIRASCLVQQFPNHATRTHCPHASRNKTENITELPCTFAFSPLQMTCKLFLGLKKQTSACHVELHDLQLAVKRRVIGGNPVQ